MSLARWLGVSFTAAITAVAFAACKSETSTGSTGGTGGASVTTSASSGGASSSSSSSSSGTGGAEADAGPLVCKGTYSTVPKGSCDLLKQDCSPNQTCKPVTNSGDYTTSCVAGGGLKSAGEDCYSAGDCAEQLFCIGGKCSPVCCHGNNVPCAGAICDLSVSFGTHQVYFCHYAPKCDLLTANACAPGLDCHIEDKVQGLATCAEPSDAHAPDLGPCSFINDCGNMEQCYTATSGGAGSCHYYCWVNGPTSAPPGLGGCPSGQVCLGTNLGQPVNFGVPGLGLCFSDGSTPPDAGGTGGGGAGSGGAGGAGGSDAGPSDAGSGDAGNPGGGGAGGSDAGGPKDAATD